MGEAECHGLARGRSSLDVGEPVDAEASESVVENGGGCNDDLIKQGCRSNRAGSGVAGRA